VFIKKIEGGGIEFLLISDKNKWGNLYEDNKFY